MTDITYPQFMALKQNLIQDLVTALQSANNQDFYGVEKSIEVAQVILKNLKDKTVDGLHPSIAHGQKWGEEN